VGSTLLAKVCGRLDGSLGVLSFGSDDGGKIRTCGYTFTLLGRFLNRDSFCDGEGYIDSE